jgi:5-methylcytosine-specific restriction endonuclease McrA
MSKYHWKPSDLQEPCYRSDEGICRDHNSVVDHLMAACVQLAAHHQKEHDRLIAELEQRHEEELDNVRTVHMREVQRANERCERLRIVCAKHGLAYEADAAIAAEQEKQ